MERMNKENNRVTEKLTETVTKSIAQCCDKQNAMIDAIVRMENTVSMGGKQRNSTQYYNMSPREVRETEPDTDDNKNKVVVDPNVLLGHIMECKWFHEEFETESRFWDDDVDP